MATLTVINALRGLSAYPVPLRQLWEAAMRRGLDVDAEATAGVLTGKAYNLVKADTYLWLSFAPDISQGGQSYSFTDEQRKQLRNMAKALYDEFDPLGDDGAAVSYGYKGSRL